jgi:hypothetical protein
MDIDEFNRVCPVGSPVTVRLYCGEVVQTKVKFPATLMRDHTVVWLEGYTGCYGLDRVTPIPAGHMDLCKME